MAARSERDKMRSGEWYSCLDDELEAMRHTARIAVHEHNTSHPDQRGALGARLAALMASVGADVFIEAPFHCAYGVNLHLGAGVYMNVGCVILDTAPVHIGPGAMLGPGVAIHCAEHDHDPARRAQGLEIARPVEIGANAWLGGGAIVLGGVRIGENAIVGAGAVVTRDVAARDTVMGVPARTRR